MGRLVKPNNFDKLAQKRAQQLTMRKPSSLRSLRGSSSAKSVKLQDAKSKNKLMRPGNDFAEGREFMESPHRPVLTVKP